MMSLSSTLLPTPAGPSRIRVSAGATEKLMSSSTGGPSKAIETPRKATTGLASGAGAGVEARERRRGS